MSRGPPPPLPAYAPAPLPLSPASASAASAASPASASTPSRVHFHTMSASNIQAQPAAVSPTNQQHSTTTHHAHTASSASVASAHADADSPSAASSSSVSSSAVGGSGASAEPACGWLLKLGGQVKKFKRRYFRVSGTRLEYFKDDASSSRRLGVIPLPGCTLVVFDKSIYGESSCFGLTPSSSKRTYCLRAASEADMHKWLGWLRPQVTKHALRDPKFFARKCHYPGAIKEGVIEQWKHDKLKYSERFLVLRAEHTDANANSNGASGGSGAVKHSLLYFKEIESPKPAGEISLDASCSVADASVGGGAGSGSAGTEPEASPHSFVVTCAQSSSGQRRFTFRAGDDEEKADWIAAIRAAIEGGAPASRLTHGVNPSMSDIHVPSTPTASGTAGTGEIQTIDKRTGFNYSDSESEGHSDLSIDSASEDEEERDQVAPLTTSFAQMSGPPSRAPPRVPQSSSLPSGPPPALPTTARPHIAPADSTAAASAGASPSAVATTATAAASAATAAIVRTNEAARLELTRVVKEGYLKKLGAQVKNWKSRYFRLVGYVLTYHESRESLTPVLGEVHLNSTLVKAEPDSLFGMPFTFSITQTQASQRTYYCVASDKEEMDEWIFLLKQRHSFAPHGLPLRLNPRVHINMLSNPDDAALRAIAVNSPPINASYISTDADRRENSKSTLKGAVSKKKRRFVMDGFDLDLTYITNRIVAMGFPADGTESLYRNDMVDVQRFFDTRHRDHYKVYNLCSERKYDHSKFHNRVLELPFDDHNVPSFEDIPFFCKDVADFLGEHEKNVAIIHCKAGKGRTGLLITIFLLYCGEWSTASEALRYYAFARTQNQKGVTIASQIRWVHYWEKYLSLSRDGVGLPRLEALALRKMVFSKKAPSFDYFVTGCHGDVLSSKDKDARIRETKLKDGGYELEFLPDAQGHPTWTFLKDFQFEFFKGKMFGGKARVMSFWLHTQFLALEPNYYLKMERMDIDKVSKDKSVADFTLELFFEPVSVGRKAAEAVAASEASEAPLSGNPLLPASLASSLAAGAPTPADAEMLSAALEMMLEGRKMTRFYLGNRAAKEKEVERREIFIVLKDETPANAPAGAARQFALSWCLDKQTPGVSPAVGGAVYERLSIVDIGQLLIGKQSDIWGRSLATRQAVEDRCLSIVSRDGAPGPRVELHLEAYSERQLALWVEGLKFLLERAAGAKVTDVAGEAFATNMLAPPQAAPTSANSGAASSNAPPAQSGAAALAAAAAAAAAASAAADDFSDLGRGRAESFARPPPIRVPQNRHRRVISIQQHRQ